MSDSKFPTEIIELPSKGYFYPKDSPLASGKVEMKYMTAREEDILTSPNLLKQGTAIDKLLEALRKKYEADVSVAKATIDIYLLKSVGIGEHPLFVDEID